MNYYATNSKKTKYSFWGKMAALVTFLTVMSQLPILVEQDLSSPVSRAVWLAFFGVVLVFKCRSLKLRIVPFAFLTVVCYTIFVLIASVFSRKGAYNTSLFSCVLLSFFVFFVSLLLGKDITEQDMYLCGQSYVFATVILAIVLYVSFYQGYDITDVQYAYGSKNSAGVMLFTGALIAFVNGWKPGKRLANLLNLLIVAFLVYMVLVMKARAMIVCIPVVALCAIWRAPFRKKIRIPLMLMCVALLVALQFDAVYSILIDNVLLAGRGDDLLSASSGRAEQWASFFQNMRGQELFGDGETEQEALILTAFLQCGILMGGLIVSYAAWPVIWAIQKTRKNASKQMFLLLLVAITYFVDAIFEQLAPFGPGVRCFFLWMIFGFALAQGSERFVEPQQEARV